MNIYSAIIGNESIYVLQFICVNGTVKKFLLLGESHLGKIPDKIDDSIDTDDLISEIINSAARNNKCIDFFLERPLDTAMYKGGYYRDFTEEYPNSAAIMGLADKFRHWGINKSDKSGYTHKGTIGGIEQNNLRVHNFDLRGSLGYDTWEDVLNDHDVVSDQFIYKLDQETKFAKHVGQTRTKISEMSKEQLAKAWGAAYQSIIYKYPGPIARITEMIEKERVTEESESHIIDYLLKTDHKIGHKIQKSYSKFLKYNPSNTDDGDNGVNNFIPANKMSLKNKVIESILSLLAEEAEAEEAEAEEADAEEAEAEEAEAEEAEVWIKPSDYDLIATDLYTLSRIFSNFDNTDIKRARSPPLCVNTLSPTNIIIYGGNDHIQNIKNVLLYYEAEILWENDNIVKKWNDCNIWEDECDIFKLINVKDICNRQTKVFTNLEDINNIIDFMST